MQAAKHRNQKAKQERKEKMADKLAEGSWKLYKAALRLFEKYYWVIFGAACLTLAFYCFRCLGVQYVDSWDEARHGVNAYEMIKNRDYIQHTYNYQVDDWNLKPSMSYWGILLGYRLFGYTVTGLRFTSALAYLLTGIACALFAKRCSKEASILVLGFFCANERPLSAHLARAGDADSLYLLFFTLAMLCMLRAKEKHKNIYVCGLMFSLAFLTKSWHAGMILAIGGIWFLCTGELFRLKPKEWLGFLLSVFAPLLLWFGWRFTKDGFTFLRQMIEVDLLARTGSSNFEGHQFPFSFYYDMVFGNEAFIYRWLLLICIAGLLVKILWMAKKRSWDRRGLEEGFGYLLWFLVPFLGFSLIGTKLIWYCYPCTVPLMLGAAVILGGFLRLPLRSREHCEVPESRALSEIQEGGKPFKGALLSGAASIGFWAAAAGTIFLTVFYMRNAYLHVIREAHGDPFQLFLQESVERDSAYAGKKAYVYVPGEDPEDIGSWDQNMLLLAELSGDFRCADGGVEGFLEERSAVLYISRENYGYYEDALAGAEILYENGAYLLLEK